MHQVQAVRRASPPDALNAALRSRGFETGDFRLEEQTSSALASALGLAGGILKVQCRSTAEERIYSTGSNSAWLGAFLMDLGKGHFSNAARCRSSGAMPLSQPAPPQRLNG